MTTTKNVPAAACYLKSGRFTFGRLSPSGSAKQTVPVEMRARSGQPIDHWYWGRVVHDMAGFTPAAQSLPIDYCHNEGEILGYLNRFRPSSDGLDCSGELVLVHADDRASEVLAKSQAGVPYQASIYFDPGTAVIEEIPAGQAAAVNGYRLDGPATVIRRWMLRAVAICPYGYDHRTETRLAAADQPLVPVRVLTAADREIRRLRFAGLSENMARYAAALSLPGRRRR